MYSEQRNFPSSNSGYKPMTPQTNYSAGGYGKSPQPNSRFSNYDDFGGPRQQYNTSNQYSNYGNQAYEPSENSSMHSKNFSVKDIEVQIQKQIEMQKNLMNNH